MRCQTVCPAFAEVMRNSRARQTSQKREQILLKRMTQSLKQTRCSLAAVLREYILSVTRVLTLYCSTQVNHCSISRLANRPKKKTINKQMKMLLAEEGLLLGRGKKTQLFHKMKSLVPRPRVKTKPLFKIRSLI